MRQQKAHFVWGGLGIFAGLGYLVLNLGYPDQANWATAAVPLAVGTAFLVYGYVQGRRQDRAR